MTASIRTIASLDLCGPGRTPCGERLGLASWVASVQMCWSWPRASLPRMNSRCPGREGWANKPTQGDPVEQRRCPRPVHQHRSPLVDKEFTPAPRLGLLWLVPADVRCLRTTERPGDPFSQMRAGDPQPALEAAASPIVRTGHGLRPDASGRCSNGDVRGRCRARPCGTPTSRTHTLLSDGAGDPVDAYR